MPSPIPQHTLLTRHREQAVSDYCMLTCYIGLLGMNNINFLMIFAPILLLVCVTAEMIITESGWKSLEKQQNRDLFFRILQSYFTGKVVNLGLGRNERLQGAYASKINSYEDKFDNDLDT
ncbi:uncharacterized protein C2orf66 homolog [Chiloscyllium plagiosum]|uniref:uncharacterized protein C2orf66 homolog n=1 Tax=Chiloscyllium plagiosum TaxID=36176 RepID=UPI001CB7FFBC|nr:uncharacterized protein C2orf66 homolog [Chiloscyllium plagiosum]